MLEWLESLGGPDFATAAVWAFVAIIVLVIVLVIARLVRSMTFGTFVAGGRNRKTRLAVMDATAVDSHRRLVLVRRDDVEHLLLIGGPTDVVVEQEIRLGQPRRPALTSDNNLEAPPPARPQPAPQPRPQPQQQPARALERPPQQPAPRPAVREPAPAPRQQPRIQQSSVPPASQLATNGISASTRQSYTPTPPPARTTSIDDTLLKELEVTFETTAPPRKPPAPVELSLDDEMTKLLGELSSQKR